MTPHIILQQFQQSQQDSQNLLVVLDDSPNLQHIVAVWPSVDKYVGKLFENHRVPKDERTHWKWLWDMCEYESKEWGFLASVPDLEYAERLIQQAIKLKLVFPDGAISEWAKNYLSTRALESLGGFDKRPRRNNDPPNKGGRRRGR